MKRLLSLLMICILSMSLFISANADQKTIPITANISGTFEVNLPTSIEIANNKTSKVPYYVQADLPHNQSLLVTIKDSIDLTNDFQNRVIANVMNSKNKYNSDEITNKTKESIQITSEYLKAGTWNGNFDVIISTVENQTNNAGLYNSEGVLLADWDTLVNTHNLDIITNLRDKPANSETNLYQILLNFEDPYKLIIPGNIERIGDGAFAYTALNTIEFLEGVNSLGVGVFVFANIDNIIFPNSLTTIEEGAFQNGTFKTITLPDTIINLGEGGFYHATFDNFTIEDNNQYYKVENGILYSADNSIAYSMINSEITDVVFNEGTKRIGGLICSDLYSVKSVTIPESCTSIGSSAFYGTAIRTLHIPKNVNSIDASVASKCQKLTTVTVDEENEFYCSYDNCIYSKDMKVLIFVPSYRKGSLIIPEGVERIACYAFDFSQLSEVTFPESLKRIDNTAFRQAKITSVYIPKNVNYIGGNPFSNCNNLGTIMIDEDNPFFTIQDNVIYTKDMKKVVASKYNSTRYRIPEGVEELADSSLSASKAKTIELPSTLKKIGALALSQNSNLSTITIPNSVEEIGNLAFYQLKEVHYNGSATSENNWGAINLIRE